MDYAMDYAIGSLSDMPGLENLLYSVLLPEQFFSGTKKMVPEKALAVSVLLVAVNDLSSRKPQNVAAAVAAVRPAAVDVSSGVEASPGVKAPALVRSFIIAARGP